MLFRSAIKDPKIAAAYKSKMDQLAPEIETTRQALASSNMMVNQIRRGMLPELNDIEKQLRLISLMGTGQNNKDKRNKLATFTLNLASKKLTELLNSNKKQLANEINSKIADANSVIAGLKGNPALAEEYNTAIKQRAALYKAKANIGFGTQKKVKSKSGGLQKTMGSTEFQRVVNLQAQGAFKQNGRVNTNSNAFKKGLVSASGDIMPDFSKMTNTERNKYIKEESPEQREARIIQERGT